MAQYYRPRRATSSDATSDAQRQASSPRDSSHRYGSDIDFDNALASSSILVFPNPPSDQETLRSDSRFEFTGSTPSLPTDVSLDSLRSRSRSRTEIETGENENENESSWHNISRTFPREWDEILPEEESEWELDAEVLRRRWDDARYTNHSPRRRSGGHVRSPSNDSSLSIGVSSLAPQPPFRLPLLSFLQSFFSLDESTLHLLSRSPDQQTSTLFPFPPGSPTPSYEEGEEEPSHGARKLLLHNPDKPQNRALLKAAMDPSEVPADANPFLVSPARIPVWRFLEFVMEGGARAWREVRAWETRETGSVGVQNRGD